ncbi:MAG: hypothetical protein HGA61_01515 [Candidatus Moranbacteria bacterium]|nr:hypothetical protein [Candidatus Moranbacteria bacterium]
MEYDVAILLDALASSLKVFYDSPLIFFVKVVVGVYLTVIFANIVMLLVLRGVSRHYRVGVKGADIPIVSKKKMRKRWNAIKDRLKSDNVSQYKVAIIEADAVVEEFLGGIGYGGENMSQRLEQVGEMHLDDQRENLAEVHKLRNRIIHEADFEINKETAKDALEVYENFLQYMQFLE